MIKIFKIIIELEFPPSFEQPLSRLLLPVEINSFPSVLLKKAVIISDTSNIFTAEYFNIESFTSKSQHIKHSIRCLQ